MTNAFENEVLEETDLVELERANPTLSGEVAIFGIHRDSAKPSEAQGSLRAVESKPGPKGRFKRTEKQMIEDMGGSPMKESAYVLDRIAKLEDKISELMGAVSQKSRDYILAERPDLARY